jgi:hypothetical protein
LITNWQGLLPKRRSLLMEDAAMNNDGAETSGGVEIVVSTNGGGT